MNINRNYSQVYKMNEVIKIYPNFLNIDFTKKFNEENLTLPKGTSQINYYQNNSSFDNCMQEDSFFPKNEKESNIVNYYDESSSQCQTPTMNIEINEQNIKEDNLENIKISNNSIDIYESSRNGEIEILPIIENIVCTANLCCKLNLREIALQVKNAEYNPKRFSAVIIKMKDPKTTALIFASGRIVCLGAKIEEISRKACRKFAKIIKSLNNKIYFKQYKIENVVGSADVKFQISLMKLYMYLLKNTSSKGQKYVAYEPEQFPGLIYRMAEPRIVLLIFVSGKIVLTGGKNRGDIYEGFKNIYPLLIKFKIENDLKNNKILHKDFVKEMERFKNKEESL